MCGLLPVLAAAFFASLAVTVMGGLAFASILTFVLVPVLYALLFRTRPPKREKAAYGEVSPA